MRRKTILLFAMPGMGKTTLVKQLNYGLPMNNRVAVDLDYQAPRVSSYDESVSANLIRSSQTNLINAYAMHGVRLITAFPQGINFNLINRKLINIVWVLPNDVQCLVQRCKTRSMEHYHCISSFDLEYENKAEEWRHEWFQLYQRTQAANDRLYTLDVTHPNYVDRVLLDILIKEDL